MARRNIRDVRFGSNEELFVRSIERSDIHATLFSQPTSHREQKASAVRQELRPAMRPFLSGAIQLCHGCGNAACGGHTVHGPESGPEQDRVIDSPRGAANLCWDGLGNDLDSTAGGGHPFQSFLCEKPHPTGVRRPERVVRILGSRQLTGVHLLQGPDPECRFESGRGGDESDRAAIRGDSELQRWNGGRGLSQETVPSGGRMDRRAASLVEDGGVRDWVENNRPASIIVAAIHRLRSRHGWRETSRPVGGAVSCDAKRAS